MKKTIAILFALLLVLAISAGCQKAETKKEDTADADVVTTATPATSEPIVTEEPEAPVTVEEQEGRYIGNSETVRVGNLTVRGAWLPMQYATWGKDRQGVYVAAAQDKVYLLTGGLLSEFVIENDILVAVQEYPAVVPKTENANYRSLNADPNGRIFLTAGAHSDACVLQDGKEIASNPERERVNILAMHPSGDWGISSWVNAGDLRKVTIEGDKFVSEEFAEPFTEMDFTHAVGISDKHILVAGRSVASENAAVFVYDLDGKPELTLGDVDSGDGRLRSTQCVVETVNGYVVASSFGDFTFFDLQGNYICDYSRTELFGKGTGGGFWELSSMTLMPNGDILVGVCITLEIDGEKGDVTLFRISGF